MEQNCNVCRGLHSTGECQPFRTESGIRVDSDTAREDGLSAEDLEGINSELGTLEGFLQDMDNGDENVGLGDMADSLESIDTIVDGRNVAYELVRENRKRANSMIRMGGEGKEEGIKLLKEWLIVAKEIFKQ